MTPATKSHSFSLNEGMSGHHGTSGYYGAVADGDACQNRGIRAYPDVLADVNRGVAHALPFGGVEVVVERSKFL